MDIEVHRANGMDNIDTIHAHRMELQVQHVFRMGQQIQYVLEVAKMAALFLKDYHSGAFDLRSMNFAAVEVPIETYLSRDIVQFQSVWEQTSDSISVLYEFLITSLLIVPRVYFDCPDRKEAMVDSFINVVGHIAGDFEISRDDIRKFIFIDDESWEICEDSRVRKLLFHFVVHKLAGTPESASLAKERYNYTRNGLLRYPPCPPPPCPSPSSRRSTSSQGNY